MTENGCCGRRRRSSSSRSPEGGRSGRSGGGDGGILWRTAAAGGAGGAGPPGGDGGRSAPGRRQHLPAPRRPDRAGRSARRALFAVSGRPEVRDGVGSAPPKGRPAPRPLGRFWGLTIGKGDGA